MATKVIKWFIQLIELLAHMTCEALMILCIPLPGKLGDEWGCVCQVWCGNVHMPLNSLVWRMEDK